MRGWRGARVATVVAIAASLTACYSQTAVFDGSKDAAGMSMAVLTPDGSDTFDLARNGDLVLASAPSTNTDHNLREVFWPSDEPTSDGEMSCSDWGDNDVSADQEGIALRIAPTANGLGTRAITVTKSVFDDAFWLFNVHTWNSTLAQPFTQIAQFDMSSVVVADGAPVPYPWHVCARVTGYSFQFMVWSGSNPQPSWQDASAVEQVTLPAGWDYLGNAGWYVGHLQAGETAGFETLRTWSVTGSFTPPTTSTSTTSTTVPETTTTTLPDTTTTTVPETSTTTVPDTTTTVGPSD